MFLENSLFGEEIENNGDDGEYLKNKIKGDRNDSLEKLKMTQDEIDEEQSEKEEEEKAEKEYIDNEKNCRAGNANPYKFKEVVRKWICCERFDEHNGTRALLNHCFWYQGEYYRVYYHQICGIVDLSKTVVKPITLQLLQKNLKVSMPMWLIPKRKKKEDNLDFIKRREIAMKKWKADRDININIFITEIENTTLEPDGHVYFKNTRVVELGSKNVFHSGRIIDNSPIDKKSEYFEEFKTRYSLFIQFAASFDTKTGKFGEEFEVLKEQKFTEGTNFHQFFCHIYKIYVEYLFKIVCNNDDEQYEYLRKYLGSLSHGMKMDVHLLLSGDKAIGKDIFSFYFMTFLLGGKVVNYVDMETVVKYTGYLAPLLVAILSDESTKTKSFKEEEIEAAYKRLDKDTVQGRCFYVKEGMIDNNANIITTTNEYQKTSRRVKRQKLSNRFRFGGKHYIEGGNYYRKLVDFFLERNKTKLISNYGNVKGKIMYEFNNEVSNFIFNIFYYVDFDRSWKASKNISEEEIEEAVDNEYCTKENIELGKCIKQMYNTLVEEKSFIKYTGEDKKEIEKEITKDFELINTIGETYTYKIENKKITGKVRKERKRINGYVVASDLKKNKIWSKNYENYERTIDHFQGEGKVVEYKKRGNNKWSDTTNETKQKIWKFTSTYAYVNFSIEIMDLLMKELNIGQEFDDKKFSDIKITYY